MKHSIVKRAAREARDLSAVVEDAALRPAAFAVLFARLLNRDGDNVRGGISPKRAISGAAQKGGGSKPTGRIGPIQRIRELIEEGFFKAPRSLKTTITELTSRGHKYDRSLVSKNLQRVVQGRLLRRTRGKEGGRDVYLHTEW